MRNNKQKKRDDDDDDVDELLERFRVFKKKIEGLFGVSVITGIPATDFPQECVTYDLDFLLQNSEDPDPLDKEWKYANILIGPGSSLILKLYRDADSPLVLPVKECNDALQIVVKTLESNGIPVDLECLRSRKGTTSRKRVLWIPLSTFAEYIHTLNIPDAPTKGWSFATVALLVMANDENNTKPFFTGAPVTTTPMCNLQINLFSYK